MSFWWLALKDTLLIAKDKKALLTLILMPMLLIAILGAAFGNLMGDGEVKIDQFALGVANLDEGELGDTMTEEVFAKGLSEMVEVRRMDEEELYRSLRDQKIAVGLLINQDFSSRVIAGKETAVKLVSIPSAQLQATITENVVQQFAREAAVRMEGMKLAITAAGGAGSKATATPATAGEASFGRIKEQAVGEEGVPVSSFQYYAAGMGVMFLLMTVTIGVSAMIEEKEQEVYKRLLVSKLTHFEYLTGKFLGLLFLSLLQLLAIMLGTHFLFSVDWGSSISGVLLIGVSFVFSASALGVMAGSFIKTEKAFSTAAMLGTQIMAAVGGSMVPLYAFPDWINHLVKVFPNALALQSFLELMSGGGVKDVLPGAAALIGLGIIFLAIGLSRLAVERRTIYA
ncbi:ABC transporter permease [Neobacillus notoginsengisoli]|uniref:ABC transporter permease n=1 Tax=Neobacillus notoginsengisoli TaxID=1578198 RepID=A0A417YPE6_9BACI|nr:ABC transporter permease [Neobacillus notoginsengisoli]RHW35702.1 ABC transporter permease [Neobacillus notoginsengisoli]